MVRQLREALGLSQAELATRVGVNRTYISRIEGGGHLNVSSEVVSRLVEALQVGSDDGQRLKLLDHLLALSSTGASAGDCAAA